MASKRPHIPVSKSAQDVTDSTTPSMSSRRPGTETSTSLRSPNTSSPSTTQTSPAGHSVSQDFQRMGSSGTLTPTLPPPVVNQPQNRPAPISLSEASHKALMSQNSDKLDGSNSRQWPVSPRLKSPANSRRNSATTRQAGEVETSDAESKPRNGRSNGHSQAESALRSPIQASNGQGAVKIPRGFSNLAPTLETVEEGDHATPPREQTELSSAESQSSRATSLTGSPEMQSQDATRKAQQVNGLPEPTPQPLQKPVDLQVPQSTARKPSIAPPKIRPGNEGVASTMTVETETVPSIPQASTTNANDKSAGTRKDENGSVRARPSSETIKPKRDRKKVVQKRPSVVSGATTSKADMFEAKINSAADDDDSDSDETFVYESNPPEPRPKGARHHSRTPSGTSIRSLADRRGAGRGTPSVLDNRAVKNKRSMKFGSSSYVGSADDEADRDYGTVRAHKPRPSPLVDAHYGDGHTSMKGLFTTPDMSPFSAASKTRKDRSARNSPLHSPRVSPPPYTRTPSKSGTITPRRLENGLLMSEQQPLLGSLRAPRTRGSRRPHNSSLRRMEFYRENPKPWARRCSGCLALLMTVCLLAMCGAGFLYATMKPLYAVSVMNIGNVLASEEELMFDLNCVATNANMVSISVADLDINVFAKSRHVGTDRFWREHGGAEPHQGHTDHTTYLSNPDLDAKLRILDNVDDGTDPQDPEDDPQTMLLGSIFHFDSALTFEASPIRRQSSNSTGELRLAKPGNKTETGGTERWERVIQYPFQLIIRGVLKYKLPLSSRTVSASVSKVITVDPDANVPGRKDLRASRLVKEQATS